MSWAEMIRAKPRVATAGGETSASSGDGARPLWLAGRPPLRSSRPRRPEAPEADAQALSAHYHFVEKYTDDPAKTDLLNQYQVGYRETVKITRDKAQGRPESDQLVVLTIYTERVEKLGRDGQVAEVVRRFDKVNRKSTLEMRPSKTKFLEG